MDATFRYSANEVRAIVLAHFLSKWPAPEGYRWHTTSDLYGSGGVKLELVEEEDRKGEAPST